MDLSTLQQERNEWVAHNFPREETSHAHHSLMGATEEVLSELIPLLVALGRANHHWIKMEARIRGTEEEHIEKIKDAVGDTVVFLAGIATRLEFDFGECVQEVWDQVKQRDWVKYPTNGVTA